MRLIAIEIVSPTWRIANISVCQNFPTLSVASDLAAPDCPIIRKMTRNSAKKVMRGLKGLLWNNVVLRFFIRVDMPKIAKVK